LYLSHKIDRGWRFVKSRGKRSVWDSRAPEYNWIPANPISSLNPKAKSRSRVSTNGPNTHERVSKGTNLPPLYE
jgi:hypothetical protein